MALCKRLIARLDVKGNRLIKGIRFEGLRVLGDACEAALNYDRAGADELLYIDAVASLYGRNSLSEILRRTSQEVFIPITAGGGVRSVKDAGELLSAGADKIAINTAALERPELITELARAFGSQCVVVSIQARRRNSAGEWEAMAEAGREKSGRDVLNWLQEVQDLGAGELLLTSVDQDGTCSGPDKLLNSEAMQLAKVPLVVGGGFSHSEEINDALMSPRISGVGIGAALHNKKIGFESIKQFLGASDLPIRQTLVNLQNLNTSNSLCKRKIGVIDYGMGNQQSLINALNSLGAIVNLSNNFSELDDCELLALPGVGSFPEGMAQLSRRGLDLYLQQWVKSKKPLLGICLGMQMLFNQGEEFRPTKGLGLIDGHVTQLPNIDKDGNSLVLPHVGWNRILSSPITTEGIIPLNQYFVHSYAVQAVPAEQIIHLCKYGHQIFIASVKKDYVAGFQFHPERSGTEGLNLLAKTIQELLK